MILDAQGNPVKVDNRPIPDVLESIDMVMEAFHNRLVALEMKLDYIYNAITTAEDEVNDG